MIFRRSPRLLDCQCPTSHSLFCPSAAAVPTKEEGKTIDIVVSMNVSVPGPMGKPDQFTVTNIDDNEPYAGGIKIKGK